jgi:hypothetical protein
MSSQSFSLKKDSLLTLTTAQSITQGNNQKYIISQYRAISHKLTTIQLFRKFTDIHQQNMAFASSPPQKCFLSFEMLLQWSKKMEVTGCKARAVRWDNMFSVKLVQKFPCDSSCMQEFLCEQARAFHSDAFLHVPPRSAIMVCILFALWPRNRDEKVLRIPKFKHRLQGPELLSFVGDKMWYVFTPQKLPSMPRLISESTTSNYVTEELWD